MAGDEVTVVIAVAAPVLSVSPVAGHAMSAPLFASVFVSMSQWRLRGIAIERSCVALESPAGLHQINIDAVDLPVAT